MDKLVKSVHNYEEIDYYYIIDCIQSVRVNVRELPCTWVWRGCNGLPGGLECSCDRGRAGPLVLSHCKITK